MSGLINSYFGSGITFTFIGSDTADSTTIDLSSLSAGAIAAGDFCVILNAARSSNAASDARPSTVLPSGFTSCQNNNSDSSTTFGDVRSIISAKILVGSETTLTGMNGGVDDFWIVLVFRPSSAISAFAWTGDGDARDGNPPEQTIVASAAAAPVILVGQMSAGTAVDPRTISPTMTEVAGPSDHHYAHYRIDNSAPQDTTYDMTDEGAGNVMQSGYFTFTA